MSLPIVRSRDEAHLYLDLHPCDQCGRADVTWESALTSDAGAPARRYHGVCPGCGRDREFVFRLPAQPALPGPDDLVFFGGPEPSELFDAGQWRLIATVGLQEGGAPRTGDPLADRELRQSFALAVAAFGEILKFIPEGGEAVPESAFWTARGRAAYDDNPDQFTRSSLEWSHRSFQLELDNRFLDL